MRLRAIKRTENLRMDNTGSADRYSNLEMLEVRELEQLIKKFPWFAMARNALLVRLAEMGPEYIEQKLKDCAAYLSSRKKIYYRTKEILEADVPLDLEMFTEEIDFDEIKQEAEHFDLDTDLYPDSREEPLEIPTENGKPRVMMVGGDYFAPEDFAELEKTERDLSGVWSGLSGQEEPAEGSGTAGSEPVYPSGIPAMTPEDFEAPEFYTETLARIYTEQGYYEEAINVYAKLILLYPEKSTYFALLVNEIKSKN